MEWQSITAITSVVLTVAINSIFVIYHYAVSREKIANNEREIKCLKHEIERLRDHIDSFISYWKVQ